MASATLWNRWRQHDTSGELVDDNEQTSRTLKKRTVRASRSRTRTQSVETVQSLPSSEDLVGRSQAQQVSNQDKANKKSNHAPDLLQWLETHCPGDCLPKILAFCGPQQTAALSRTNKHWNEVIRAESTWRVLCEELYKVRFC